MTEIARPGACARPGPGSQAAADAALLLELRPLVVRTARLCAGPGSAFAEDAAQEALLELSRALPSIVDRQAAPAFAARIAARVAIRMAKRERRLALIGLALRPLAAAAGREAPADLLELKEAFDRLPARQRATAVLRLYVGLSEQETAAALGCSVGTVKRQLHNARRGLAAYLADSPAGPT
jgi:RNA polymerase sigma factor (sigma-70 family)